ncbi:MAG TPA: HAMP domain-containing sensor histidine kinase [Nitriliruptorales bacterium]|nr:HAMP domain-containing sensor histidine kinase [Nitriliruptorales bacterium]
MTSAGEPGLGTPERTRLLATAHHELNTPLSVIRGWADTLSQLWDNLSDDERRRGIQTIGRAATELATLLSGVLAEVRSDNLARHVQVGPVDVAAVVREVADRPERRAEAPAGPVVALTDATALETLLEHLIDAHRGSEPDPATVTTVSIDRPDPGTVRLTIHTAGAPPLPEFDLDEPLRPADRSAVTLRLLAVDRLARALDGALDIRHGASGLTTSVTLPAAP